MTKPLAGPHRGRHRRVARHRPRRGARLRRSAGAHVIALARTQGALEELDDEIRAAGGSATLVPLDLKDYDALDRLGAAIHERWGKLDILLGNAGMLGELSPLAHVDPAGLGRGDGGQRHRQLAADPLARPAAARVRRRPRDLPDLRRRPQAASPIGAPTRSPRRRSRRWSAPMRPRPRRRRCASCWSTPARCAPACAPPPCRARTRMTLRRRKISRRIFVRLASPAWSETGKIYDFPQDRVLTPQGPG